jgi:hypothetical protein
MNPKFPNPPKKRKTAKDRIKGIWIGMISRCCNKKSKSYKYYGARGIKICDKWLHNFESFYQWSLANGYADDLSIDRINNDGNYCPENCRWATQLQQANNNRNCRYIEINNEVKTLSGWSRYFGIDDAVVRNRMRKGWDIQAALLTPVRPKRKNYTGLIMAYNGKEMTIEDWAAFTGIDVSILRKRVGYGWGIKKILTTPVWNPLSI